MGDEEQPEERVIVDYDAIDDSTGFKTVELGIMRALEQFLAKPEDDRGELDAFVDEYAEEHKIDKKRVKYVATVGIYAGLRDTFNQRTGSGKAVYANGDTYDGEFFEGKKSGSGHYTFRREKRAEVDLLLEKLFKDKPADESTDDFVKRASSTLRIGSVIVETALQYGFFPCYHGDYHKGLRVGHGLMRNKDGSVYKGEWTNNKRHGQGIFYYINGDVFSGMWSEGLKHGFGTYQFADGGQYQGEWDKGVFVEGQWIMADGNYYEGRFDKRNKPNDIHASLHFPNKSISVTGVYQKGRWAPLNELVYSEERPVNSDWVA